MAATTWGKFYWSDWRGDPALRACGLAARGLWMEMLCIAASHDPVGYVCINGRPLGAPDLARMAGATEAEVSGLLAELERNGVFSRDRRGRIHSRRMVRDAKRSEEGRKHGRLGGNPSLRGPKGDPATLNPRDNPPVNPGGSTQNPEARKRRSSRASDPSPGQVTAEVNGWKVASLAEQCCALLDVGDLRFPELPGAVAELLAEGADPDRHIYPAMRNVARRGVEGVGSVRYLAAAVRGLMREAA